MNVEVEAKIKVPRFTHIRSRLRACGAFFRSCVYERNLIFDRSGGELRKRGQRLRLRIQRDLDAEDAQPILTFKGKRLDGALKRRPEVEVVVTDSENMIQILSAMGYACVFSYEKRRESWRLDRGTIEFDQLPLIGRYVEVEGPNTMTVREALGHLGLEEHRSIRRGYVALLRRRLRKSGERRTHLPLTDEFDAPAGSSCEQSFNVAM